MNPTCSWFDWLALRVAVAIEIKIKHNYLQQKELVFKCGKNSVIFTFHGSLISLPFPWSTIVYIHLYGPEKI